MELKTLKDMNICPDCTLEGDHIHLKELKQEAIKRWKYFKKKYMDETEGKKREEYLIHFWGRMEEIKEFNNLTSEELKNE